MLDLLPLHGKVDLNFLDVIIHESCILVLACHMNFLCWFIDEWRMILRYSEFP